MEISYQIPNIFFFDNARIPAGTCTAWKGASVSARTEGVIGILGNALEKVRRKMIEKVS